MSLSPISIATGGYVCGTGPGDISIATDGYVCTAGIIITPEPEVGGGSGGREVRQQKRGHGHVVTVQLPGQRPGESLLDDTDLALLAVMLIQEFYD